MREEQLGLYKSVMHRTFQKHEQAGQYQQYQLVGLFCFCFSSDKNNQTSEAERLSITWPY